MSHVSRHLPPLASSIRFSPIYAHYPFPTLSVSVVTLTLPSPSRSYPFFTLPDLSTFYPRDLSVDTLSPSLAFPCLSLPFLSYTAAFHRYINCRVTACISLVYSLTLSHFEDSEPLIPPKRTLILRRFDC